MHTVKVTQFSLTRQPLVERHRFRFAWVAHLYAVWRTLTAAPSNTGFVDVEVI